MSTSTTSETSPHRTCPNEAEPDKIRKVCNRRGVKVNHLWYWSEELRMPHLNGKSIQIRVDPWDVRFVFALVDSEWIRCWSKLARLTHDYTEVEVRCAFAEMARTSPDPTGQPMGGNPLHQEGKPQ